MIRLLILCFVVFTLHRYLELDANDSTWLLVGFILVGVMPAIGVHAWYTDCSRNKEVILEDLKITYKKDDQISSYRYEDIAYVKYNKLASYDSGYYISGIEPFRNIQIVASNNQVFVITCLMYSNLEELMDFFTGKGIEAKVNNGSIGFGTKTNRIPEG